MIQAKTRKKIEEKLREQKSYMSPSRIRNILSKGYERKDLPSIKVLEGWQKGVKCCDFKYPLPMILEGYLIHCAKWKSDLRDEDTGEFMPCDTGVRESISNGISYLLTSYRSPFCGDGDAYKKLHTEMMLKGAVNRILELEQGRLLAEGYNVN